MTAPTSSSVSAGFYYDAEGYLRTNEPNPPTTTVDGKTRKPDDRTGHTNTGTALHALDANGRALCGRFVTHTYTRTDVVVTCRQCRRRMR